MVRSLYTYLHPSNQPFIVLSSLAQTAYLLLTLSGLLTWGIPADSCSVIMPLHCESSDSSASQALPTVLHIWPFENEEETHGNNLF
jgi:hypothetical protein